MSASKCARCEQTVYPVEGLRCLDKIWHKGCFKCHECNMTLSLKNYKGFEKRPYCNAHCPQAKATTVADTPEIRRLAENTRIQSQAKYHEDFEKSKGKGFTAIADDPETLRIKEASKIISNVAYHGELERKKQMEEKRGLSGPEDVHVSSNNNNNSGKHQNNMQLINVPHNQEAIHQSQSSLEQNHYQLQHQRQVQQQQMQHQQQLQLQQQQAHHKQQQQHQMHFAQDHSGQPIMNRQSQMIDGQQQSALKHMRQQQYPVGHPHQQQLIMRQQQQQQQMMLQQQQLRQSNEPNVPSNRQQPVKQATTNHHHHHHPQQQMIKHQPMNPVQQQSQHPMKYPQVGDAMMHPPMHLVGASHMISQPSQLGAIPNNQRVMNQAMMAGPQGSHPMIRGYNQYQVAHMNGAVLPKQQQQQQHFINSQPRHLIHPSQIQQMNHPQMRPHPHGPPQQVPLQQQMPGRVFKAMYDYMANDVDEVSFFENDILIDCVNVDRNWLIGKVARSGETGMLPANYVAELPSQ